MVGQVQRLISFSSCYVASEQTTRIHTVKRTRTPRREEREREREKRTKWKRNDLFGCWYRSHSNWVIQIRHRDEQKKGEQAYEWETWCRAVKHPISFFNSRRLRTVDLASVLLYKWTQNETKYYGWMLDGLSLLEWCRSAWAAPILRLRQRQARRHFMLPSIQKLICNLPALMLMNESEFNHQLKKFVKCSRYLWLNRCSVYIYLYLIYKLNFRRWILNACGFIVFDYNMLFAFNSWEERSHAHPQTPKTLC